MSRIDAARVGVEDHGANEFCIKAQPAWRMIL